MLADVLCTIIAKARYYLESQVAHLEAQSSYLPTRHDRTTSTKKKFQDQG